MRGPLFVTIVLDGVGIGAQPDAGLYGDAGSATLQHVLARESPTLPNLRQAGLGNIAHLPGLEPVHRPDASWARMQEQSAGKDSTTGHWELSGLRLERPLPTYPDGFPDQVLTSFKQITGVEDILGNCVASGTEIIERLGEKHLETAQPILYTSADSVFQIAAHTDRVPLATLYNWCGQARRQVCIGPHGVGRVIARPFTGRPGSFRRLSDKRKDYALEPPDGTLQQRLRRAGVRTVSIGKVADLFAGVDFDETHKTGRNAVGIETLLRWLQEWDGTPAFVWVNLIDFDQEFGHRNDPSGFAACLEEFDVALPEIRRAMRGQAALCVTADHGNDPTHPGTDHTREFVPVLLYSGQPAHDLGVRDSFNDHAATVLSWFGIEDPSPGIPMLTPYQ